MSLKVVWLAKLNVVSDLSEANYKKQNSDTESPTNRDKIVLLASA